VLERRRHPGADLGVYGRFTLSNVTRVVAAPFEDRYAAHVSPLKACAAVVVAGAFAWAVARCGRPGRPELRLLVVLVISPFVALAFVSTIGGTDVMHPRYLASSVPFILVIVATAIVRVPRPLGVIMAGVLLAAAIAGDLGSHRRDGFYPDYRGMADAVAGDWRSGDVLLYQGGLNMEIPVTYYAGQRLPAGAPIRAVTAAGTRRLLVPRPRVWVTWYERYPPDFSRAPLRGYRKLSTRRFRASADLLLAAAVPERASQSGRSAARR
jgi:hypothetical protein